MKEERRKEVPGKSCSGWGGDLRDASRFLLRVAAGVSFGTALCLFAIGSKAVLAQGGSTNYEFLGAIAPAFAVQSIEGVPLELESLRGKVVVLNFWYIACPPCRVEIPEMNLLVKEYRDRPVVFIGFAPDTEAELREFLAEHPFSYHIVAEATPIAERYKISGAPSHVIIDREGRVAAARFGAIKDPDRELGALIEPLLSR